MSNTLPTIAIVGGTGDLGTGLARRWARAGYPIIIGSRTADRAETAVADLRTFLRERGCADTAVTAMDNIAAATRANIVVVTVPFGHQIATLDGIKAAVQGKIVVDVTVPLMPPKVMRVQLPPQGSAGKIAQERLGENVRVVSAFQNVAAVYLQNDAPLDFDILVCGNDKEAREEVVKLVVAAGMRGFHAGSIDNSAATEALTSLLIFINKQYQCHSGIRITGV